MRAAAVTKSPVRPVVPAWPGVVPRGTALRRTLVFAGFVALYLAAQIFSYSQRSATYDESLHLAAGYAALTQRDFRYDPTHPPLARMWAALPLIGSPDVRFHPSAIDHATPAEWYPRMYADAHQFLYASPQAETLLNRARFMNVLLGVALAALLFAWTESWLGFGPAVAVLAFYLLSPNLLAHAGLVTTDLPVTLLFFGTIYFLWRSCQVFSAGNVAGLAACFALAQATKFSAVLLVPVVVLLLAVAMRYSPAMTARRAAGVLLLLVVTTWGTLWAVYGFRYEPSATAGWVLPFDAQIANRLGLTWRTQPIMWATSHHLLPNAYTLGFLFSVTSSQDQPGYLAGEIGRGGWWYYFPVTFLMKTPASLVVLAAGGLALILARFKRIGPAMVAFVLVPPAVFLAAAMTTGINIGYRHILPVMPFVLMIAAVAVQAAIETRRLPWIKWGLLGTLATCWVFSFAAVYPHTLTFFNAFIGGPRHGRYYLADSNLDWGQHLKLLKKWMTRQGVDRINLAYFGTADPAWHGINCRMLPGARDFLASRVTKPDLPGYVAIGATVLSGPYLTPEWRLLYAGFEHREPVAVLGNALRIYWVGKWPEIPRQDEPESTTAEDHALLGNDLVRLGWNNRAIYHYRRYLQSRPDDPRAHGALGAALLGAGRTTGALVEFHRSADLDPTAAGPRRRLAVLHYQRGEFDESATQLRRLIELNPQDARAWGYLAVVLARSGHPAESSQAMSRAEQLAPDDPTIRRQRELIRQSGALAPRRR